VNIGDLGAKMGLNGIDNGWIQFDHVRIPHAHMLSRYAHPAIKSSNLDPLD
jgi:acyl-CoA oxidase